MDITYKEFLSKVADKLSWVTDEVDFLYPYTTRHGKYENAKPIPYIWTCGFYGGILWYMYKLTGEDKYLKLAKQSAKRLDGGLTEYVEMSHDVGFQFLYTNVADANITGDEASKIRGLHAATILAGRYNPAGQFIRAWNDNPYIDGGETKTGYVIIDCMMNIPLLYWASEVTGDSRYKQIANLHADTVIKHFVREDGSVNHIVVFNPDNGEVVNKPKGQGYSEGSAWTRGQGWAIYGFAMAYHYTKNERYLETARKVADYFISRMNDKYMPIDLIQPEKPEYEDCSAAAIAACGILEILKYADSDKYKKMVDVFMNILYKNCNFEQDEQSILQNCSEMYYREESRHVSLIYGDYYMLEALMRLNGHDVLFYL